MGITHKLKPEIKNWILEQKQTNPSLSCRQCILLVQKQFNVEVSKSSINTIFKQTGLSMPVGRTNKKSPKTLLPPSSSEALIKAVTPLLTGPALEKPALPKLEGIKLPNISQTPLITPVPSEADTQSSMPPVEQIPLPEQQAPDEPTQTTAELAAQKMQDIHNQIYSCGAILLKAMDYLINASSYINELINRRLHLMDNNLPASIESIIYSPLLAISEEEIQASLLKLQPADSIAQNLLHRIYEALIRVRCLKILLNTDEDLYLDGQLHTVWSGPHMPHDFATTIFNCKKYINKYFYEQEALILFAAPGYDIPSSDFINLILGLLGKTKKIKLITFYNDKLEELESIRVPDDKPKYLIFGMWPWQYTEYRKVKKIGEYKDYYCENLKKTFYAADIEIDLYIADKSEIFTFRGYALKSAPGEKARMLILTNMPQESIDPQNLLETYLGHWPNFEEAFNDLSQKVELFTYTAESAVIFSPESLKAPDILDVKQVLSYYLLTLDMYFRWHFLPPGYENKDFSACSAEFYKLKTTVDSGVGQTLISFEAPKNTSSLKALEYALRRLNEREITLDNNRVWFSVKN